MRYYTSNFIWAHWVVLAWLRHPRQRWGWMVAGPLWPITSTLWLILQLRYGDDWYQRISY